MLTGFTPYTCGKGAYLLTGILTRKLLTSLVECCCLAFEECGDLFFTPYLLNFPTNKNHNVLKQDNGEGGGARLRLSTQQCLLILTVGSNIAELGIIAFVDNKTFLILLQMLQHEYSHVHC